MSPPDPHLGRVVKAAWRIDHFVARGAMGSVYRGTHLPDGSPVAVKVLHPEFLHDPLIRERFRREAMVSSVANSPHVVRVYDLSYESDGAVYLIMEWLSGVSLGAYYSLRGQLRPGEVVTLVTQISRGLGAAHRAGIIHRDLKPGNVFLVRDPASGSPLVKIVDFGLSKVLAAAGQLTASSTMLGTPHYMPVEQFESSADVDERADIYALGVLAYEALAGRRPFRDGTPVQILKEITSSPPAPLPESVPTDVAAVVLQAMSRPRDERWATADAFSNALRGAAAAAGVAPEPMDDLPPAADVAPSAAAAAPPSPQPPMVPGGLAYPPQAQGPPRAPGPQVPPGPPPPQPVPGPGMGYGYGHRPPGPKRYTPTPVWVVIVSTLGGMALLMWLVWLVS